MSYIHYMQAAVVITDNNTVPSQMPDTGLILYICDCACKNRACRHIKFGKHSWLRFFANQLYDHEISHPYSSLMNYSNIVTEYKYVFCSSTEKWPVLWWIRSVVCAHLPCFLSFSYILTTKVISFQWISTVVLVFLSQKWSRAKSTFHA